MQKFLDMIVLKTKQYSIQLDIWNYILPFSYSLTLPQFGSLFVDIFLAFALLSFVFVGFYNLYELCTLLLRTDESRNKAVLLRRSCSPYGYTNLLEHVIS